MTLEVEVEDGLPVTLPSGVVFFVLTQEEVDYIVDLAGRYQTDNYFQNISDLQDLDRILMFELLCHRYGLWLSRTRDYSGDTVDEGRLQRMLAEYSSEIRQLKKMLAIDKVARDRARGDDSVAAYLEMVRQKCKEIGIVRETQLDKALCLFNDLMALLHLHDVCDEIERREQHVTTDDVLEWIRSIAIPEYQVIDEYFRSKPDGQRYWVRKM